MVVFAEYWFGYIQNHLNGFVGGYCAQNNQFVGVDYVDNRPKGEYVEPTVVEEVPSEAVTVDAETGEILDNDDPLA